MDYQKAPEFFSLNNQFIFSVKDRNGLFYIDRKDRKIKPTTSFSFGMGLLIPTELIDLESGDIIFLNNHYHLVLQPSGYGLKTIKLNTLEKKEYYVLDFEYENYYNKLWIINSVFNGNKENLSDEEVEFIEEIVTEEVKKEFRGR